MLNDRLFYQETSVCIDLKVLFPSAELTPRISGLGSSVALSQARLFCAQTLQLKLLKSEGNQKTSQIPEEILWSQSLQDFGNGDNTTHSKVCIIAVCCCCFRWRSCVERSTGRKVFLWLGGAARQGDQRN